MRLRGVSLLATVVALIATSCSTERHASPEQAVIVHFSYGSTDLHPLFNLEDRLEKAIIAARVGEFDGDEVAADGSDGSLYMYGPDADRLFETVKPILQSTHFMRGAKVVVRYGPPKDGTREVIVTIAP